MNTQNAPKIWVVIPAAGIGSRMQAERPKQYLKIRDEYLIDITVQKMLQLPNIEGVIVALSKQDPYWQQCHVANHPNVYRIEGGSERSDSVFNALEFCWGIINKQGTDEQSTEKQSTEKQSTDDTWVLVHDAARPCVTLEKIELLIETAINNAFKHIAEGAILAAPVADTVKRIIANNEIAATEDRSQLWLAHTPQFFPLDRLRLALKTCACQSIPVTDEASAVEAVGGKVSVVADRRDNIKITVPEDLGRAEMILHHQGRW